MTVALAAAILALGSTGAAASGAADWSYDGDTGPAHWADLGYPDCAGDSQSPINIRTRRVVRKPMKNPRIRYVASEAEVVNNGHSIEAEAPAGSTMTTGGVVYELKQIHFHTRSEHTIDGDHYPIEVHFVHQANSGQTAVVAVLAELGKKANRAWEPYVTAAEELSEADPPETVEADIDWAAMLPRSSAGFRYEGSLTTPPCTEGVHWNVLATPVRLSEQQIEAFESVPLSQAPSGANYRPVQPRNGRVVTLDVSRGFGRR
ncbi:MAG: carbonic anhydrase family protein [Candidatus Nanopelagicales bacterium]